jgi:hypothetical protein
MLSTRKRQFHPNLQIETNEVVSVTNQIAAGATSEKFFQPEEIDLLFQFGEFTIPEEEQTTAKRCPLCMTDNLFNARACKQCKVPFSNEPLLIHRKKKSTDVVNYKKAESKRTRVFYALSAAAIIFIIYLYWQS